MNIKTLLSFTILIYGAALHAEELETRKNKAIEGIDQRIEHLSNLKSCISSTSKKEELKRCRQEHRNKMKAFRETRRAERKNNQEKKITLLEERLKKLKEEKPKTDSL